MNERPTQSLLAGRSTEPLDQNAVRSVTRTFVGLDDTVPYRHDPEGYTRLVIEKDEDDLDIGVVCFSSDIYPGPGYADPNSALSMKAAVAHEMSHFHRWKDQLELKPLGKNRDLDEAMTSLDAALRYASHLIKHELEQLVSDSLQRLAAHNQKLTDNDALAHRAQ